MGTRLPSATISEGVIECRSGIQIGTIFKFNGSVAPTDGASGTGAGFAPIGSEYTDTSTGKLYINTGTEASPTWTVVGTQS